MNVSRVYRNNELDSAPLDISQLAELKKNPNVVFCPYFDVRQESERRVLPVF